MADMPKITITITGSDGSKAESNIIPPIVILIPKELSLRVATMHILEYAAREIRKRLKDGLKGIGFK